MLNRPAWKATRHREAGEDEVGGVVERVADRLRTSRTRRRPGAAARGADRRRSMRTMRPAMRKASATLTSGSSTISAQRRQADGGPASRARRPRPGGPAPAIIRPSVRSSAAAAVDLADDAAGEHHQDAVGERQDLVELDRDHQHGAARVAALHQLAMDELDGADVDAARRLADQQDLRARAPSRAPAPASAGCRRRSSTSAGRARAGARRSAPSARRNGRRRPAVIEQDRGG